MHTATKNVRPMHNVPFALPALPKKELTETGFVFGTTDPGQKQGQGPGIRAGAKAGAEAAANARAETETGVGAGTLADKANTLTWREKKDEYRTISQYS